MRDILFRGKQTNADRIFYKSDGDWIYGSLIIRKDNENIKAYISAPLANREVDPETVGQYTGLTDKKTIKIFGGDIVKCTQDKREDICVIDFESGSFIACPQSGNIHETSLWDYWYNDWDVEVIGNIYDNPELIKEES